MRLRTAWLGFALMQLAACITVPPTTLEPPPPAPAQPAPVPVEVVREKVIVTPAVSDTDRLLSYYAHVSALSKEQYGKELEQARRFYESTGGSFARMKYVLARLAGAAEPRDHEKNLELLQGQLSAKDDSSAELRTLAALLKYVIGENRALESSLEALREKLKEETKKSEALKQKLDALVEAERKLLERNRPK